jgi:hypothetical protein
MFGMLVLSLAGTADRDIKAPIVPYRGTPCKVLLLRLFHGPGQPRLVYFGQYRTGPTGHRDRIGRHAPMGQILWIILVIIVAFWLIGFVADIAGNLIHLLLVVALIVLAYNLISGRKEL